MTSSAILIPARFASTRFPGKPLAMLGKKTMIRRVYDACIASKIPTYVVTDSMQVYNQFNANTCFIEETEYENGTARCAGAIKHEFFSKYDTFINVQGDMPDVTLDMIEGTLSNLKDYDVSTMCAMMPEEKQNDPHTVKLVRGAGKCLWFGRGMTGYGDWHLGIYGYKRKALEQYDNLIITKEERHESLEQLRWLKNGWNIGVLPCEFSGMEINTPEELEQWNELNGNNSKR